MAEDQGLTKPKWKRLFRTNKQINIQKRFQLQDVKYLFFLFGAAVLLLLFCTKNSPAYRFQPWPDPNIYMDIGRAVRSGAVLYRDVFDHKGPLLLLAFSLISYIPFTDYSMTGVYIFQCILLFMSLYYVYRTSRVLLGSAPSFGVGLLFLLFFLGMPAYRQGGGSAEEILMPVFTGSLFHLVSAYRLKSNISKSGGDPISSSTSLPYNKFSIDEQGGLRFDGTSFFVVGLFVGIAALVKINLAVLPAVVAVFILIPVVLSRSFKNSAKAILYLLGGVSLAVTPCVIYFLITGSFRDCWDAYITFNLLYAQEGANVATRLTFLDAAWYGIFQNMITVLFLLVGALCLILTCKEIKLVGKLSLFASFSAIFLAIYISKRDYPYIFIPLVSFVGITAASVFAVAQRLFARANLPRTKRFLASLPGTAITCIIATIIICLSNNSWREISYFQPEQYPVEIISSQIKQDWQGNDKGKSPSILFFACQDFGVMQMTQSIPQVRYFYCPMIQTSLYTEAIDSQMYYIGMGMPDYVVILSAEEEFPLDISKLNSAYKVMTHEPPNEKYPWHIIVYDKQQ